MYMHAPKLKQKTRADKRHFAENQQSHLRRQIEIPVEMSHCFMPESRLNAGLINLCLSFTI